MNEDNQGKHITVLRDEAIAGLGIVSGGIYVDCTLGGGGHSEAICRALGHQGTLIGIDQDQYALSRTETRLRSQRCHKIFVRNNFVDLETVLDNAGIKKADGFLFDLGVSSFQFDQAERGFSYHHDGPLDMRMDRSRSLTAERVVNTYSQEDLKRILWGYGEEKMSGRVAAAIVKARAQAPITRTGQLAEIVKAAYPEKLKRKGHPAKKTFQALRIEVNGELRILNDALKSAIDRLNPGGRICVITFHSLEDRLVKRLFTEQADPLYLPAGIAAMCLRPGADD